MSHFIGIINAAPTIFKYVEGEFIKRLRYDIAQSKNCNKCKSKCCKHIVLILISSKELDKRYYSEYVTSELIILFNA